jgi:hypothetical protein
VRIEVNENSKIQMALSDFDSARVAFQTTIVDAPESSLDYLKPGDDYALGGLVYHVNAVLEHYMGVLDALDTSGFQETEAKDRPGLFEEANARAKAGLDPSERDAILSAMAQLHSDVRGRAAGFSEADFERKAPVRYESGADPYPTSPADVLGWLTEHYREHVPHAEQLLASWRGQ